MKEENLNVIKEAHGLITENEGELLFSLARDVSPEGVIVEIGSYKGGSTIFLARGVKIAEKEKVYAVDPHSRRKEFRMGVELVQKNTFSIFTQNIKNAGVDDWVIPIVKTSYQAAKGWRKPIRLLWIDGSHKYEHVKIDFLLWERHLVKGGVIALHDTQTSDNVDPTTGFPTGGIGKNGGPARVAEEYILRSPRFKDIKIVDSITYALKIKNANLLESLKNRMSLYSAIKNIISRRICNFLELPSVMMLFSQLYNEYRYKILSRIFNKTIIKPWMKYREIEIAKDILKHLQPQKCLEWGGGYSTLYFPHFVNKNSKWITIDYNKDWAAKIKDMNRNSNVEIFYIKPNNFPSSRDITEWGYRDLKDYLEFPARFGNFDFILIDGGARRECLIKAHALLGDRGVVVLHDANDRRYHGPFALYKYRVLFKDYRNSAGGLWIGSKGVDIEDTFNMGRHKALYKFYAKAGNAGKLLRL